MDDNIPFNVQSHKRSVRRVTFPTDCLSEEAQEHERALLGVHEDGGRHKEQEKLMKTLDVFAEEPTGTSDVEIENLVYKVKETT